MTEPVAETHPHENAPGAARLIALTDGIYAIAMTLLVINVAISAHLDDAAFHKALSDALPNLGAFALSSP
ncbi:TMEM175 family protein [Streptomyces sp. NPDC059697]|uniref:TMEM175 family protein n=1 Tax=Streptomyces sp. NPDC059697 TaxID=3346912 RepID=UPI00367EE421